MTALVAALGALACTVLLLRGFVMARTGPGYTLDLDEDGAGRPERRSLVAALYSRLGRLSGPTVGQVLGPRWRAWVSDLLAAAGQPRGMDLARFCEFQGSYLTLGGVLLLVLVLSGHLLPGVMMSAGMVAYPVLWLVGEASRRQRQIERDLPDFLDILAVTVSAGLGFRQALDRVAETLTGPLADEVRRTLRRMDVGVRRRQAFVELRERNPRSATLGLFVTAILQAEELGAPLADTMNQLASDMRREFSQQARRRAARAAPRVSLIVTMVIMPGIVLLVVTSIFLGSDFHWFGT